MRRRMRKVWQGIVDVAMAMVRIVVSVGDEVL